METVGNIQVVASINTKDYDAGKKHIEKGNDELESNAKKTSSGFSAAWAGAIGGLVATVAQKGFAVISNSIDGAVKRVDTLNNFPRVLQAMGFSAEESSTATDKLSESLKGLPTTLQDGASGIQSLVAAGLKVPRATDAFLAINNALLATGGNAADTQIVMDGLSRAISAGSVDSSTLQATLSRMPTVLQALTKETGKSSNELFNLYSTDPQKLLDDMIRLNKDGGAGLASLEKQARDATGGIGTGLENLQTSITRSIASIITTIGSENISNAISSIGSGFEIVLKTISDVIGFISSSGAQFTNWVRENSVLVTNLSIIFGTLLLPKIVAFGIQSTIALAKFTAGMVVAGVQSLVAGARMAAAWLLALGPIGLIVAAVAGATALIIANWEAVSSFVGGVWANITKWAGDTWNSIKSFFGNTAGWFGSIFTSASNNIKYAFSGIISFFKGLWDGIVSIFGSVGTSVGNAISNAFKSVISGVLSGAINIINGFINAINGAIGAINSIPGVDIGKLGTLSVPQFAEGGFTGRGGKYEPAGIVHKGEYVVPKKYVNQTTGLPEVGSLGGSRTANITNNYVVNNQADAEIISRKQAYAMGAV